MLFKGPALSVLTLILYPFTSGYKQCNDCQKYTDCAPAADLVMRKMDESTVRMFREFQCGHDYEWNEVMICCSDFGEPIALFNRQEEEEPETDHSDKLKLLPTTTCGNNTSGSRIVGGEIANLYEFPWMALISIEISYYSFEITYQFKCSGSIINSRYILTAAHCVKGQKIGGVRVGEYDTSSPKDCQVHGRENVCECHLKDMDVEEIIIHEYYQTHPYIDNDIALLRVTEEIDFFHENVKPICLPVLPSLLDKDLTSEVGTVAGWGNNDAGSSSSVLLKVDLPIKSQEECRWFYRNASSVEDRFTNKFCAGCINKDSCKGDSGGPLMINSIYDGVNRFVQFGVVSYGPIRCGSSVPGVYTDVRKYLDWILKNIRA